MKSNLESKIILSIVTTPVLMGLMAVESVGQRLKELGELSEEIFRGERLPVLHFQGEQKVD